MQPTTADKQAQYVAMVDKARARHSENFPQRFWSRINWVSDVVACWEWKSKRSLVSGRPVVRVKSLGFPGIVPASRIAYMLYHGIWPDDKHILHRCNNPLCCNPHHLYMGTPVDNHIDSVRAGTFKPIVASCGEAAYQSKLTNDGVRLIRRVYPLLKRHEKGTFARMLGVSIGLLQQVVNCTIWKHI